MTDVTLMPIRVFIVEDHPVVREMLADYLVMSPDIELAGAVGTATEATAQLDEAEATIVLVDVSLPDRSGLELLAEIRTRWRLPCLVLSGHAELSYVKRALAAGARGYVLKGNPFELRDALRQVQSGEIYLSEPLRRTALVEGATGA